MNYKFISPKIGKAVRDYYLYDMYSTPRAVGAVNGTQAEPIGGTRTVIDTNGKVSVAGGFLSFATGAVSYDGVRYAQQTRVLGKSFLARITRPDTVGNQQVGLNFNTTGAAHEGILFAGTNLYSRLNTGYVLAGTVAATTYQTASIMRTTGTWNFIKGGAFTYWTLIYVTTFVGTAMYPTIFAANATAPFTADNARVPEQVYIPAPLQSDGMSASTTDGSGNPENNGTVGSTYTNIGTWGVSAGKRSCSALSGGLGFSYLGTTSSNVILQAVCTRSAGVAGLVARYADASNYLTAYLDGTNAKLDKVVAGVTTNLISGAVTYGSTKTFALHLDGTSARLFYDNLAVGTVATTPAAGSLNHGLYTTDTGATFDDLVIWPKGNSEEQYEALNLL